MRIYLLTLFLLISSLVFAQPMGTYYASSYHSSSNGLIKETKQVIKVSRTIILIEDGYGESINGFTVTETSIKYNKDYTEIEGEATFKTLDDSNRLCAFSISKIGNIYIVKYYENKGHIFFYCEKTDFY